MITMDQQTQWHLSRYGRPIRQLGGRYTLLHLLGSGGMADVCLAWDEQNKRQVAVKVMIPDVLDPGRAQRFLREGEMAVSLHHQHIIHVYDYGDRVQTEISGAPDSASSDELIVPYMVMEYVKGGNFKEWLEKKWFVLEQLCPLDEILHIFEQLCAAVHYVHSQGLVHRDIKPANILFRELPQKGGQIEAVLSDFGLALADNATASQPYAGTLAYMAPEQRDGVPQAASDIFSLGVVLYLLFTGYSPFSPGSLILSLQQLKKPSELNPSLPPALDNVLLQALSDDPAQRFSSAYLFWQAIDNAMKQPPSLPVLKVNAGKQPASLLSSAVTESNPTQEVPASSIPNPITPRISPSNRKKIAIITLITLMVLLLGGGIAFGAISNQNPPPTLSASVTIMPRLQSQNNTFSLTAKLGQTNVDTNASTIPAKMLSSARSATKSGTTTGQADCIPILNYCKQAVSQDDVDQLAQALLSQVQTQIQQDIHQQIQAPSTMAVTNIFYAKEIVTPTPPVGTVSDTVTVTVSSQGFQEAINTDNTRTIATQKLQKQLPPNYSLIKTTLLFSSPIIQGIDAQGTVQLKIAVAAITRYTITPGDISSIRKHIIGKSQKQAHDIIVQNSNLDPNNISITISSGNTLPENAQQIKITTINPPTMPPVQLPTV